MEKGYGLEVRPQRIVVGISGATGAILGVRLLEVLKNLNTETHLVITEPAKRTILYETSYPLEEVISLASYHHEIDNVGAAIASGSFDTNGMVVIPCSMKTLSAIVHSYNENLLVRAADVTLKEGRRLVLVVRETPLHKGHLELMLKAADLGAVILPPMMAFYFRPQTIDDLINHIVGKALNALGIPQSLTKEWGICEGEEIADLTRRNGRSQGIH